MWAQVMELVELEGLADSIVGKPGMSGLSVEQRKRLTIAVELVANPSIIFMVRAGWPPPAPAARAAGPCGAGAPCWCRNGSGRTQPPCAAAPWNSAQSGAKHCRAV